jgi:hypothetical protein
MVEYFTDSRFESFGMKTTYLDRIVMIFLGKCYDSTLTLSNYIQFTSQYIILHYITYTAE